MSPELAAFDERLGRLERLFEQIASRVSLDHRELTELRIAAELAGLRPIVDEAVGRVPSRPRAVMIATADVFGCSTADLVSPLRAEPIVAARFAAIWTMRHTLPVSLPQIGRYLGGRDHTTIAHGLRAADRRRARDLSYRLVTDSLVSTLGARFARIDAPAQETQA